MPAAGSANTPAARALSSRAAGSGAAFALAALWLLPPLLPFAERPSLHFYREWLAGAVGVAACALWLLARPTHVFVPRTAVLLLALGVYVLVQATLVDAPYAGPALGYALYLVWAALLATAAAGVRDLVGADRVIGLIAGAALFAGILGAGAGLMQRLGAPAWMDALIAYAPPGAAVSGNLQQPSYFADQMLLGTVAAGFLFAARRISAGVLVAAATLMCAGLSLSTSRATLLTLPLLLLAAIALSLRARSRGSARLVAALCLAGAAFTAAELALTRWLPAPLTPPVLGASTLARSSVAGDDGGLAPRRLLWEKSLEIFSEHPVFGVGPDGFPWHFYRSLRDTALVPYTIHSHNLVTQTLVCFGLAGTVLVVAMLAAWGRQYASRLLALGWWPVTGMLVVMFVRASLDLNFWFEHLLAPAVVLLGVGDMKGRSSRGARVRIALVAALALTALVLTITLHSFRQMAAIWSERPPPREIERRLADARRNPFFTPLVDSIVADALPVDARSDLSQLALNSRSMNWRPTPRMVWRQTALLALNGYERQACDLLVNARRIYPRRETTFRALLDRAGSPPPAPIAALRAQLDALAGGASPEAACGAVVSSH
jgi:hypothetical protein